MASGRKKPSTATINITVYFLRPGSSARVIPSTIHRTPRHATPRHATPRHATPRHATRGPAGWLRLGGVHQGQPQGLHAAGGRRPHPREGRVRVEVPGGGGAKQHFFFKTYNDAYFSLNPEFNNGGAPSSSRRVPGASETQRPAA